MGEVIRFPDETACARGGKYIDASTEPATVIILPVVRIERTADNSDGCEPHPDKPANRRRRRRLIR